jgi:leucyl aminopeptidase (aminopeptidase T)
VPDHADLTRRLADLIVGYGANVQPGQIVAVTTYPGRRAHREVTRASYEHGARWVDVVVFDPRIEARAAPARRRVDPRLRAAVA